MHFGDDALHNGFFNAIMGFSLSVASPKSAPTAVGAAQVGAAPSTVVASQGMSLLAKLGLGVTGVVLLGLALAHFFPSKPVGPPKESWES